MRRFLKSLFGAEDQPSQSRTREHLTAQSWPSVIYAIGDVHGCFAQLRSLEAQIVADASAIQGEKWIVMMGDYVDRGPDSAQVLDHLLRAPPHGFKRLCLTGNHELMMLDYVRAPRPDSAFLQHGGVETLRSYGLDIAASQADTPSRWRQALSAHIPPEHIEFIEGLPATLRVDRTLFVHAGIRPLVDLMDQSEDDLFWIREPFLSTDFSNQFRIVHGHTPVAEPSMEGNRIAIDTGAFATGRLTAARLTADTCSYLTSQT